MQPVEPRGSDMRLYLAYDAFLTARQLTFVIEAIDDSYMLLSHSEEFRRERMTFPERARLRVARAETGNSIQLVFQAGQETLADFLGSGDLIVGGAGILAATTALLVDAFRRIRVERQRAQLGAVVVESARTELELRRDRQLLEIRKDELEVILRETIIDVARAEAVLGLRTSEQIAELATKLARPVASLDQQLNAPNITQASLNGHDLVASPTETPPEA